MNWLVDVVGQNLRTRCTVYEHRALTWPSPHPIGREKLPQVNHQAFKPPSTTKQWPVT